jgi:L-asparaginase
MESTGPRIIVEHCSGRDMRIPGLSFQVSSLNIIAVLVVAAIMMILPTSVTAQSKSKIAVFSGPRATVQSTQPLVTSNKARLRSGLQPLLNTDGSEIEFDHLAPQRLAVPVEVLIEAHSAHPLEQDASELYAPPDGYVNSQGVFHQSQQSPQDKPVYKAVLRPDDGLYLLPYMAKQANGSAWDGDCAFPFAPEHKCRQPFFPDASRIFEEIDRGILGINAQGRANSLSSRAEYDFYRAVPSGGYRKGLVSSKRTDTGEGDIPPEVLGEDFFVYKPFHLGNFARFHDLAKASNAVTRALNEGVYAGGIWFEASPSLEETLYWLNLVVDTPLPLVGVAAQRSHRAISADGPQNIIDAIDYILSLQWSGEQEKDQVGAVLIESEQIIASRQVQKSDARPGGYIATGDHGGVIGSIGAPGPVVLYFTPRMRHTWSSQVNLSQLPGSVMGVLRRNDGWHTQDISIKDQDGYLIAEALPRIDIVKMAHFSQDSAQADPELAVAIMAQIERNLELNPLAGFVAEGESPYGNMTLEQSSALEIAAFSGMPTVSVGRGNAGGPTATRPYNVFIEGNNLTASKARVLLIASMMKFGSLPVAKNPRDATAAEKQAVQKVIADYQTIFNTH